MNLEKFKLECKELNPEVIVQKNIIEGSSYFFEEIETGEEFDFKKCLSESLNVHYRDLIIVGSAKLGFSIKPDKANNSFYEYKEFDQDYKVDNNKNKSDIDVAIISEKLFDLLLLNLYKQSDCYRSNELVWGDRSSFAKYILKGWFRPDFMPLDFKISPSTAPVIKEFEKKYRRCINIGIYKSWFYFESYHKNNIYNIQLNNIANGQNI